MLYGSGLRDGFRQHGANCPRTTRSTSGLKKDSASRTSGEAKARFDVVNLLDRVYELRDGSGVGVGAPQFGQRRGIYGGHQHRLRPAGGEEGDRARAEMT